MIAAGSYLHIAGAADDGLVRAGLTVLRSVVVGGPAAGETLSVHDAPALADANADNLVSQLDLDAVSQSCFDVYLRQGLVVVLSGGTPDITVIWG